MGVFVGPQKTGALAVVCDLRNWCGKHGIDLRAVGSTAHQVECAPLAEENGQIAEDLDLMVVLGGDGTMLGAARLIGDRQIPVLGVNFGWLGYLTEFTLGELFQALDAMLDGKFS